jgi:hypothetical protein
VATGDVTQPASDNAPTASNAKNLMNMGKRTRNKPSHIVMDVAVAERGDKAKTMRNAKPP